VIVVGDRGLRPHTAGILFEVAAAHHKREIERNAFPGLPRFNNKSDIIHDPIRISSVTDLNNVLGRFNNIKYLAYFGNSGAGGVGGALNIGEKAEPDTNLCNSPIATNASPVINLTNLYNINPSAQVRLFGCRGGYINSTTTDTTLFAPGCIAEDIANELPSGVAVYGYKSTGGSLFTQNKKLGHGSTKRISQKEVDARFDRIKIGAPLWLVAAGQHRGWASFGGKK
jgi:hypothetical protein